VFLFLNSWRSTVITGLTLPIALIGTFLFMYLFGFTINTITLMALSLCVGLLIDDAIVVRENIVRHVQMGKSAHDAALDGTNEIGLAVLATTLSIVAVFLPIGFMGGIIGKFFHEFGITIVAAVLISMFVSFTLDPMLSSVWHDPQAHGRTKARRSRCTTRPSAASPAPSTASRPGCPTPTRPSWAGRWCTAQDGADRAGHLRRQLLHHAAAGRRVRAQGRLLGDGGQLLHAGGLVAGGHRGARARSTPRCARLPEVRTPSPPSTAASRPGKIYGSSTCAWSTARTAQRSVDQLTVPLRERLARIPGITVTNIGVPTWAAARRCSSRSRAPTWPNWSACGADRPAAARIPGLVDLDSTLKPDKPTVAIQMRRDAASDLGLNVNAVAGALRTLVAGQTVGNWRAADGETYDVRVRLAPESPRRPQRPAAPAADRGRRADGSAARGAPVAGGRRAAVHRPEPDQPPRPDARDQRRRQRAGPQRRRRVGRHPRGSTRWPGRRATATASAARPRTCRTASATRWRRWRWPSSSST
jgi:HAE1 family hydrophobic/amphiphilic exporter-1